MKVPIEQAVQIASENIKEIRTVREWAETMGYECPKKYSRKLRNYFGETPKLRLVEIRVEKIFLNIIFEPNMGCYEIALEVGLNDEIALSKFLKRHTGKSPNHWQELFDLF